MATTTLVATTLVRSSNEHRIISKHTPVPFLLEAFPVPPSHIPPSPAVSPVSPCNPPPSLPPSAPLPPVPGPSPLSECDTIHLIQPARRPSSKLSIRSVSSSSSDPIARTRTRNGSLSSLRSFHSATGSLARNDLAHPISEEGPYNVHPDPTAPLRDIPDALKPAFDLKSAEDTLSSFPLPPFTKPPRKSSRASELPIPFDRPRSTSPDVSAIIQATPRPRSRPRVSSHSRPRISNSKSRSRANSLNGYRSSGSSKHLPNPREFEVEVEDEDAHDSDSSIDLHTPLPHLMLRHGLLSPHSKLLPTPPPDPSRLSIASNFSQASLQSNFSTFSNQSDASLVTNSSTGSKHPKDSRDTPSRRVRHRDGRLLRGGIGLTTGLGWSDSEDEDAPSPLTRRLSALNLSRRSSATSISTSHSYSSLRSPHPLSKSISHSILREEEGEDDVDEFGRVVRAGARTVHGPTDYGRVIRDGPFSKSLPFSTRTQPLTSRSKTRSHKPKDETRVPIPSEDELGLGMDGVTPTRAAFRDSAGSSSSGLGTGTGTGNGSSTASTSSLSLPFPATPRSPIAFSPTSPNPISLSSSLGSMSSSLGPGSNHTLTLPPSRSSTPSSCNIDKSPRDFANPRDISSIAIPRKSSISIPSPSQSATSSNPRESSFTNPSSPRESGTQSPLPRTLKLLQPGEQLPRPGGVLMYNRNVHDHIKRTQSQSQPQSPVTQSQSQTLPLSPVMRSLVIPGNVGSVGNTGMSMSMGIAGSMSKSMGMGNGDRPKSRTGTGMVYRSSSGPAGSRMRVPSAVRPSGVGVAL
ncbi:hypothetical protein EDB19DRAFT_1084181 [Suillus lakei]|nr:hypothetical protein EDB19DRAFT_1084181 [Suillus lakei]